MIYEWDKSNIDYDNIKNQQFINDEHYKIPTPASLDAL